MDDSMSHAAAPQPDYYRLLGVAHNATPEDIRRAYRRAMKEIHPDTKSPDARAVAEERTKTLNIAYTTLSQTEKRRQYDDLLRASAVQDQIMSRYAGDMITPNPRSSAQRPPPRYQSERQRQEQQSADRSAMSSLFYVFGGAALFVILAIAMFAVIGLVIGRVF